MKPGRIKHNDTLLCSVQFIIDHPDLSPYQIADSVPIAARTVYEIRDMLGIRDCISRVKLKPDALAAKAGWDVRKAAELIEANGYEMTTREVMALCAVRPWSRRRVREYVRTLKGECANG